MWPPFRLTTSCKQTLAFVTFARKCSAAQGPHSAVVPHAFWRLVSKSCDECKGSFVRGCETKRWSHWTCSSLGTIFQPMRINSVPDVKCFCNNKNALCAQSVVWHFVRHPVWSQPHEVEDLMRSHHTKEMTNEGHHNQGTATIVPWTWALAGRTWLQQMLTKWWSMIL